MAEETGFEPAIRCRIHDFESCAFNHSATLPPFILSFSPPKNKLRIPTLRSSALPLPPQKTLGLRS